MQAMAHSSTRPVLIAILEFMGVDHRAEVEPRPRGTAAGSTGVASSVPIAAMRADALSSFEVAPTPARVIL
jgi:hypothetical protein